MLDRFLLKIYLVILLVFTSSTVAYSQYNSEEELKKAADKFFAEENYIEALPLFSQLLSTYPKDLNYNYKYGACYLYGTRDKEKAINYLSFAASRPNVDPLAYYYLAKAYHHNYEFASAIVYFNKYKGKTSSKEHQQYEIDRQIEMCKNGQQLLKKINKIGVISKKEIKESEFFRSYDLRGLQGKVIVKPDEFKMKVDKKENEYSILYSDPNLNVVVFSSYGDKGSNKDIYKIEKIGINQFSDPISLGDIINTPYDEDYAFLHPDGKTLYFSSKGHNSMGGYDIFKSIYNDASATWSTPVNLDFPINTPDDDILYISDIDNQLAYFASSRASKQNELTVYKVKVEPEPLHNPIIKGLFVSEENPSLKNATISIVDAMDNTKYGVYNTDENSGEYLLTFPADEKKYKLIVETTNDAPIHSAIIELPKMTEFKLLKQELLLVGTGDNEKLVIKNLFDQEDEFDISNPIIVQNLLKQQAKLDVNISEEDALKSINDGSSTLAANETSDSEYADYSDDKLKTVANKKIEDMLQKTEKSEEEKDFYFNYAATKTNEAKNQYNQDTKNKDVVAEDVNSASLALKLARVTQNEAVERNSDKPKLLEYQQKLEAVISSGNRSEAELIMAEIEKIENAAYFENSAVEVETKLADENLKTAKADYQKQRDIVIGYTNRKLELEKSIAAIESQIEETKKSKDKEALQDQLATYKIDLEDLEFQIEKSKAKELLAKQEFDKAKNEANLLANVIDAAKKQTTKSPTLANEAILATESNIKFFEEEGVLGYYPATTSSSTSTSATSSSLVAMKDDYEIIDDNGNLIDYNTQYANQVDENENNPTAIVDINKQWIAAIEEDIEIKNSLKNSATTVGEKEELSKIITQLETLKQQKEEEIDLQTNLALQNETNNTTTSTQNIVTENNNNNTNTTTTSKTSTKKYETSIIDKDGNVIDYNAQFLEELEQLPADEQTAKLFAQKAEIYNKWADATQQEITLKKIELVEADANEVPEIQEDLDELTSDLQDKQEFTALFLTQAKALAATEDELAYVEDIENKIAGNNTESNELASNETSNNNQNNTTSSNQKVNTGQYNNISINNDGSVNDYATEYENQLADLELRSDNKVKISEEQIAVTTNWIEAIDEEIAYQNERLIATDDENEKATIENRIADLKEQKSTQIAQLNTFQTELIAAKSIAANGTSNEVAVNETTTSNTTSQNQVSKEKSSYNSTTAKNMLANVDELTEEVNALRVKADNTEDEAYKTANTTEKEEKLAEAEEINNQANDKEIEIATLYERANSTEFKDNQSTVDALLKSIGGQSTDNNYIMAEMLNDESVTLFNEASDARQQAVVTNNFKQKKDLLDEAAKLEKEAIEKQQNAIGLLEQISTSSSIAAANNNQNNIEENVIAEETTTNNNQQTNNNTEEDVLAEETTTINNNQQTSNNNQSSANNRKSSTNNNQQQVTVYEPKNIELPSKERKQDAIQLEKEAITLNQEAKQLDETAENTKNRKEKQALVEEAKQKREEADRKAKEAEVIYAEVKEMEAEEELYLEELATQRKELVATVLTPEEESYVQSLTPEEKAAITNTPEFKEYKELKQSSRRLVKEAQVEYIAADKAKEEADDQKQLGVALQALQQAAATEADKNKLANQMKKLEDMIAQNEQKAIELREQATAKEQQALEENKKANTMVANKDENSALGFVALEKTNDTSDEMLADYAKEVNSSLPENQRRQQANNKTEEDVLAEETTTNNNQQTTNNQQQTNNNTEEDVITEETTTSNNQQTTNNQQQTNNTEEDIIAEESIINNNNQQTTNNNPQSTNSQQSIANIDEIPQELTESIFAITSPNESAYNENKRIPKNPKLPEGLVFKVQIGAFRNPIPQDHYKGFAPLMAEDAGNGITRYTAGLFKTFNVANMAKNEIRTMGYPDAFVVAFFNGKRININEARAMLAETPTTEEEISFTNTNQTNNQQPSNNNQTTNNNTPITTEEVKDGISKDVRNIEGVFYTIQVGVYSKPITADQLNNLTPLNSERTANGLIRYTSGIYKNLNDANTAKNRAVNLGITDAFIIAYQNGNKITVAQANELLGSNNSTPANNNTTEVEVTNENASSNNNTSENNTSTVENDNATSTNTTTTNENNEAPNETVETTNTNEETTITNEEPIVTSKPKTDEELRQVAESLNIVFKVKIGEFTDEISNEDAAVLLKLSDRNIENFVDGDKTIYTIGNLLDYKSALNTQLEMKEMGVKSPSVVAFKNSTIIPVEEALELIKNVE